MTGSGLLTRLGLGLVLLAGGGVALMAHDLRRVGPPRSEPVVVSIDEHAHLAKVAHDLRRQGLLRHAWPFIVWARLSRRDRAVHWGEYLITTPLSPLELLARLTAPPDALHPLTVPEGLTVRDVVSLLASAGFGSEESFLCLLEDRRFLASEDLPPEGAEGYLFPDTYTFPLATPQARILRGMIHRFHEVAGADFARRAADLGLTEHQAVTLASLVEAETGREEERRLVAAVFLNRLHIGMPLQSDPTVLYGREGHDRTITRADLHRPTPFNTYTIPGLPPTPIGNPGRAALEAAVNPAPVDYLYFVARGDGTHQFSRTLAAHATAVARFQRHEHH
ncbi:MAG TPA: endolytic transglycosylase MltG [Candidatus Nitrosopolaris sp.]|nr:endolytic transglycosylase MltG [Candidatus Nitrosopolaris sp.]